MSNNEDIKINGWIEYRKLVLNELQRLDSEIKSIYSIITENKDLTFDNARILEQLIADKMKKEVEKIEHRLEQSSEKIEHKFEQHDDKLQTLDNKATYIYATAGAISFIIGLLIALITAYVTWNPHK
jgi:hypothetical protein